MAASNSSARRRKVPDWLIGLGIALVLFVVAMTAIQVVGAGDNPQFVGSTTSSTALPGGG